MYVKHNLRDNPLYTVWAHIIQRCCNSNNIEYKNYGGRGINVCSKWRSFINFYNDMIGTYQKGLSIDRIDNDKGYFKDNCRWATLSEQNANRRTYGEIKYKGVYFHKPTKKYIAQLSVNGKTKRIGQYLSDVEAADAFDQYIITHGIERKLNKASERKSK